MTLAAVTNAPPARPPADRGSDGSARDDGFGAVLDAQAQPRPSTGGSGKTAAKGAAGTGAIDGAQPGSAGQGIEALLARLSESVTPGLDVAAASNSTQALDVDGDATSKKAKSAAIAAETPTPAGADPLAAMVAFLPGVAATPAVRATEETAGEPGSAGNAALAQTLDAKSLPGKAPDAKMLDPKPNGPETSIDIAFVSSAGHLAPAPSFEPGAGAAVAGSTAKPSPDHETAVAALASHTQPEATVSDTTFQALAGAVTTLASEAAAASDATPASAVPADPTTPQLAPARSLTLQLTPGDLGSVTVRLHLTGDGLDVHLAVENHKTLAAIAHARDELATAIGDNGYKVGSLSIQSADASSTSTAGSNDSARSQSDTGAGQSFSDGSGGSPKREGDRRRADPREPGSDRGAGGVFV